MAAKQLILVTFAIIASMSNSYAGPCSPEIDRMQARIDARLEARAAASRSAPESADALLHRQPTPGSIAAAEERLRELSDQTVATITQAMERARKADSVGDKAACDRALAEVQRAIGS
jgi:hypothetical protein